MRSPRHSGGYRPNNESALQAAQIALSAEKVPDRVVEQIPVSLIMPDPLQPRTKHDPDEIRSLAQSIALQGQLSPIRVVKLRQPKGKYTYRIREGERRYWAVKEAKKELIDAIVVDDRANEEKILDDQIAENIERDDISLADTCRAIERYKTQFKRTYKYLADNQFFKRAKGDENWIGDRLRAWNRADDETRALMEDFPNVLSHVEVIVTVEKPGLRHELVAATRAGASVVELREMIKRNAPKSKAPPATPKTTPEPTPEVQPQPQAEPEVAGRAMLAPTEPISAPDLFPLPEVSTHNGPAPAPIQHALGVQVAREPLDFSPQRVEPPQPEPTEEEVYGSNFFEGQTIRLTAGDLSRNLTTVERMVDLLATDAAFVLENRHTDAKAKSALALHIGRIEAKLQELRAVLG